MNNPHLSIVSPIYNEEDSLEELITELKTVLNQLQTTYEIILVNDGSNDNSETKLQTLSTIHPEVKPIHFSKNFGQTAAMGAGIDYASGDIIITIDADLQNDPSSIPDLLSKMDEGFDIVSGWRKDRKDKALSRKLPSLIANRMIGKITGVQIHDYGCTLKAYKATVIKQVKFYGDMHRFLPAYATKFGAKVAEIPVKHRARKHGTTKYGLISRILRVFVDMFMIRFYLKYFDRPLHLFGKWGLYFLIGSFITGIFTLFLKFQKSISFVETPLPTLTIFLGTIGLILLILGVIAEILIRIYFESTGNKPYILKPKK